MGNIDFQTLQQKEQSIITDVQLQTGEEVPPLDSEWDRIFARAVAGLSKIFDRGIMVAFRDVFLSSTQDPKVLDEYSGWTKTPQKLATRAVLRVSGTGTPSAVISGGTGGVNYVAPDGQKFFFETDITIPGSGIVDEDITAFNAGAEGNLSGVDLAITAQNADISDKLTVTAITNAGEEDEDVESWRAEMMRVARRPVLSDNYSYYYSTARQVDDVTAGYPYVGVPGQLDLYIERTADPVPAAGERIPDSAILTNVEEYFDGTADGTVRLPVDLFGNIPDDATTARFRVFAVTETGFTVRVYNIDPDTTENRSDIEQAIKEYFTERRPYVKGVSVRNTSTITPDGLNAAIQNVVDANNMDGFGGAEFSLDTTWLPISSKYVLGQGELANVTVEFTS
jgi:uncharacterized phage protein gp47/JayE